MSQAVEAGGGDKPRSGRGWLAWLTRLLGLALLAVLLARLDLAQIGATLRDADLLLIGLALAGVLPLILVKTVRWRGILRAQGLEMGLWHAFLAYFGSLFIGFLTPGRLGEFVKALHVSRDCRVSVATGFSSVLADRLFDLYALLIVGGMALPALAVGNGGLLAYGGVVLVLTVPLALFLNDATWPRIRALGLRLGRVGEKLFGEGSLSEDIRAGLAGLTPRRTLEAAALTVLGYAIFYGQCYLLALALRLPLGPGPVTFAVALGSLVTLIPVSISGLGTREATMIAYLSAYGVAAEAAISFSLLVFVTFYIAGGLTGALAWVIRPVPLSALRRGR